MIALAALIGLLYVGRVFFITIVVAGIITFLLEPVVQLFMRFRLPRAFASFLVCSITLTILYLAGLAVYTQLASLSEDLPVYSQRIGELVDTTSARIDEIEKRTMEAVLPKRMQAPAPTPDPNAGKRNRKKNEPAVPLPIQEVRIHPEPRPLIGYLSEYLANIYEVLITASFVPFLVYFMLSWSDHFRRGFLYLFEGEDRHIAGKCWEGVGEIARAYVVGNFFLGLLLGVVSAAFFFYMKIPYWPLVGAVSGLVSLVPYIGLPLAVTPPLIAAVPVISEPGQYVLIIIVIGFFHVMALNLLYPKMIGSRVHLNPLAVTLALMFWSMLWGGIGLVLAIPITAALKAVCDNVRRLQPYGKLLGD